MTVREEAERLNISVHTLKNWQNRRESPLEGVENLVSRANKLSSSRQILPRELLTVPSHAPLLGSMVDFLESLDLSLPAKLLYFMINFLHFRSGSDPDDSGETLEEMIKSPGLEKVPAEELRLRMKALSPADRICPLPPSSLFRAFFKKSLKREYDLPGLVYQCLRKEGGRSRQGAWFTPRHVIDSMIKSHIRSSDSLFDPCCGSGQFLCRYAELKGSPRGVSGMDLDPMAVFITRINLYIRFPSMEDLNFVSRGDSLQISSWRLGGRCLVATNPPWGAHLSGDIRKKMRGRYPEIKSAESASLFLRRCVEELPPGGAASFLLPDSLCYVRSHRDIRSYLLHNAPPFRIIPRGRLFHSVYSEVFSCDFRKGGRQRKVKVGRTGSHSLKRYARNPDQIFNIHSSEDEAVLITRIREKGSRSLPQDCRWLLGVVTGDNKRFIGEAAEGGPPLLTGKDIRPFQLSPPSLCLRSSEGPLQQSRKPEEYAQTKLVYRFIGYTPLFAIDRKGEMTLNSANSLVLPDRDCGLELEELALWYNSALFRFIWLKQFRSVKMLRRHLENLPVPLWNNDEKMQIRYLVQNAEKGQDISSFTNKMIFDHYGLNEEERRLVLGQNEY